MAPGNGANHKNSKSKKKAATATSSQLPPALFTSPDSSSEPANTKCDPADPFSTAAEAFTSSCNRALTSHDRALALRTLWDTALEVGRKMALGGLEEIKGDALAEGMELGKVLGRREEMENCKKDVEKSYKQGYMVGREVGACEEGERWGKNGHSGDGMCSQAAPIGTTHDIAIQTPSSSEGRTSTCTVSTQTVPLPAVPAHTVETLVMPSEKVPKLNWADDVEAILPTPVFHSPPQRNLSTLSTGATRPFGTLQRHVNRSCSYLRQPRQSHHFMQPPPYTRATPWGPTITHCHPSGIASGKPVFALPSSIRGRIWAPSIHLDWDQDPRLINLSNALRSLGWVRPFG